MNSEFKKIKDNNDTRYVLETATAGATSTGAGATVPGTLGSVKKREDNILAQEAGKEKDAPKPRNFVAKNAKMGGAGKMKDKSKTLPRHEKHKKPVAEDFEDLPDELMDPAVWKKLPINQKYKALVNARLTPDQGSYYYGWMNGDLQSNDKPYPDNVYTPYNIRKGELDLNKVYRKALAKYQDRKHSSDLTSQDREYELEIGTAGRAEIIRKANELVEMKREKLRQERLEDEAIAFQRAETIQQRKDEMKKIEMKYQHDLTVIDKEHRNNMESIKTNNKHDINKIDKEHAEAARVRDWESSERDKDRPKPEKPKPEPEMPAPEQEPRPRPSPGAGNNFDQDTGEPIRPQSNQWHTNQQVGYTLTKPSKKDDDVVDVEPKPPKPNKPLSLKEKITVVKDPAKATGIQQTGGVTHGSVYAGKPITQPYRITPGATYTPGKPLPQSLQQKLDPAAPSAPDIAVDAKGRTRQQWVKLVKTKFPDAKIMQSKIVDGPAFAMLQDGRKLSWNKVEQGVAEGVSDLSYDAQSLITKLRRDVEEKRLRPTPEAVLAAARELAGDMEFAPQLLVKQVLGQGIAEKIDSRFRKTEWIPIADALKILKHYGATIEEWGGHFHFAYYDREGVRKRIEDLTWNADDTRNVRLSILNQAVRELKAQQQGVAEGERTMSRAAKGHEKYGKDGMKALAKAGRNGASEKKLDAIRDKHDNYNEEFNGEYDDEAGMAQSNLITTARAVMGLLKTIKDRDNLPEWGQEKIAKAEMMLVSVWDYLQSQKQMGNDPQVEAYGRYDRRDAYQRDYDHSVAGMGRRNNHRDDERHDLDPSDWYIVKDGKMYKVSVYPNQEQEAISRGYSRTRDEAKARAGEQGVSEVAPPGWEKTVKAMKKHDNIDNPFALAWSMKNKGYKSHKKESADPYFESLRAKVEKLAKK